MVARWMPSVIQMGTKTALAAALVAALAACSSPRVPTIQKCPAIAPVALPCPGWPVLEDAPAPGTPEEQRALIQELRARLKDGQAVHAQCAARARTWDDSWATCGAE